MNRAARGDLHQPGALGLVEIPVQPDLAADLVEQAFFRLAVLTVLCVDACMTEAHLDLIECQPLPLRIHAECDRRSRAECCEQVLVGPGSAIGTSVGFRFIREQAVPSCLDLLREPLTGNGAHDYLCRHVDLPAGRLPATF